jgi:uncharacterized protein YeaO (DUF488 family)
MPVRTRRWDQPKKRGDGYRLLICRYRPRGVTKEAETWDTWCPELGPSKELHAAYYGKSGERITWDVYRQRYLQEMEAQAELIEELATLVAEGKTITLLCSSACKKSSTCHRTLLRELIEKRLPASAQQPVEESGAKG